MQLLKEKFDSGQPSQLAQADLSRNFLQLIDFLPIKGSKYIHLVVKTENRISLEKEYMTFWSNMQHIIYAFVVMHDVFVSC